MSQQPIVISSLRENLKCYIMYSLISYLLFHCHCEINMYCMRTGGSPEVGGDALVGCAKHGSAVLCASGSSGRTGAISGLTLSIVSPLYNSIVAIMYIIFFLNNRLQ